MKIKKIAAALTASALLCGALAIPANAAEPQYEKGDVNMDGIIDASDATLVLASFMEFILDAGHTLSEEQLALADVYESEPTVSLDGNVSTVNAADASAILCYFLAKDMGYADATFENAWQFCG